MHFRRSTLTGALVAISALLAAELGAAATAVATPPSTLNATFQDLSAVTTSFRQADGNTFISQHVAVMYAGDIAGPVAETINLTIHPDGSITGNGTDVCTCTIAGSGLAGTLVSPFTATGNVATGVVTGSFTLGDGTGGLTNLHGVGTFASTDGGVSGTFTAQYHLHP